MKDARGEERCWRHCLKDHLTPVKLCLSLEAVHEAGLLDRPSTTRAQDVILARTKQYGRWKHL
jgi:hypothetical protein